MNEEMETTAVDSTGDGTSSLVDTVPVDTSPEVTTPQPVEVISVDELLDRLASGEENDGTDSEKVTEEVTESEMVESSEEVLEDAGPSNADQALVLLESVQQDIDHPFLTTDFADYTVTEGLLLMGLLFAVISLCIKMLKEGFSWL